MDNKAQFLATAIQDIQSTIRAIDVKVGALMVGLFAPFSNLGRICAHFKHILSFNVYLGWIFITIFFLSWIIALVALVRAIAAVDDPAKHITNHSKHKGTFYGGGLYKFGFLDIFLNRELIKASKDVASLEAAIPSTKKEIETELVFEQLKLIYIRDIKLYRLKQGITYSSVWFLVGIFSYLLSKSI